MEGDRTYLGRSAACHGIVTEGGEIHSDRTAEVSSGRISRESDEGPNSKGAASRTQAGLDERANRPALSYALPIVYFDSLGLPLFNGDA